MRVLQISLFVFLGIIRCQGQATRSPLNAYVKDILYTQIADKVGLRLPLILNLGGFIYFQDVKVANNRIYFHQKRKLENYATLAHKMVSDEIRQSLTTEFIKGCQPGGSLQLKAYDKDRLLFNLTYRDSIQEQRLRLETLSNKFTKEVSFRGYKQQSNIVRKRQALFSSEVFTYASAPPTAQTELSENSSLKKPDQASSSLTSISYHQKGHAETVGELSKTEWLTYDENNRLIRIISKNKLGDAIDSTRLTYDQDQLISRDFFDKKDKISQTYHYNANRQLLEKKITTPKKQYKIFYVYDRQNRVNEIDVEEASSNLRKKLEFTYNIKSELLSISIINQRKSTGKHTLKRQCTFTYDSMGNISTFREVNRRGKISKEVNFQLNHLTEAERL